MKSKRKIFNFLFVLSLILCFPLSASAATVYDDFTYNYSLKTYNVQIDGQQIDLNYTVGNVVGLSYGETIPALLYLKADTTNNSTLNAYFVTGIDTDYIDIKPIQVLGTSDASITDITEKITYASKSVPGGGTKTFKQRAIEVGTQIQKPLDPGEQAALWMDFEWKGDGDDWYRWENTTRCYYTQTAYEWTTFSSGYILGNLIGQMTYSHSMASYDFMDLFGENIDTTFSSNSSTSPSIEADNNFQKLLKEKEVRMKEIAEGKRAFEDYKVEIYDSEGNLVLATTASDYYGNMKSIEREYALISSSQ